MQMEIDILKETINVLKKDPGIDQASLKNSPINTAIFAIESVSFSAKINSGTDTGAFMGF